VEVRQARQQADQIISHYLERLTKELHSQRQVLSLLSPKAILKRGYVLVRDASGSLVRTTQQARKAGTLLLEFSDDTIKTEVKE
jgi:exodeoxyribonuclease VII large subunit